MAYRNHRTAGMPELSLTRYPAHDRRARPRAGYLPLYTLRQSNLPHVCRVKVM